MLMPHEVQLYLAQGAGRRLQGAGCKCLVQGVSL